MDFSGSPSLLAIAALVGFVLLEALFRLAA